MSLKDTLLDIINPIPKVFNQDKGKPSQHKGPEVRPQGPGLNKGEVKVRKAHGLATTAKRTKYSTSSSKGASGGPAPKGFGGASATGHVSAPKKRHGSFHQAIKSSNGPRQKALNLEDAFFSDLLGVAPDGFFDGSNPEKDTWGKEEALGLGLSALPAIGAIGKVASRSSSPIANAVRPLARAWFTGERAIKTPLGKGIDGLNPMMGPSKAPWIPKQEPLQIGRGSYRMPPIKPNGPKTFWQDDVDKAWEQSTLHPQYTRPTW